jgi:hypothetical protein
MVFNATFNNISVLLLWGLVLLVVKTGVPGENRTLDYPFIGDKYKPAADFFI